MIKKWQDFNSLNENKLYDKAMNRVDYYYMDYDVDLSIVREKYNLIEDNAYRAFATFAENIEHFLDLPCQKIALINYPPKRYSKRALMTAINDVKELDIDEIEFPWNKKYMEFKKEDWREIILDCSNHGIKLRPMLEVGIQDEEDIKTIITYLREIGIYSIMTSTGLIPEVTTIKKWNDIKDSMPRMFEVKVGGILTLSDINEFIKSDVDLTATTIDLKFNYVEDDNRNKDTK